MNYYEELGVALSASAEEVRRAYRNVARVLHPDQQADEALRRLAGLQMTRLNEILRTLTDPRLRREYDRSLRRTEGVTDAAPAPRAGYRVRWSSVTWLCAALVVIGVLVVFLVHDTGAEQVVVGQDEAAGARSNWPTGRDAPRERLPNRESVGFGGEWFYAQPARPTGARDLYPPEYIDVEIGENGGNLKGKYSAKYSVMGRPISSFVFFEFGGSGLPPSANLKWRGSGKVGGNVHLTLVSARLLRVEWSTDRAGEEQSLVSGTATLVRRELH